MTQRRKDDPKIFFASLRLCVKLSSDNSALPSLRSDVIRETLKVINFIRGGV